MSGIEYHPVSHSGLIGFGEAVNVSYVWVSRSGDPDRADLMAKETFTTLGSVYSIGWDASYVSKMFFSNGAALVLRGAKDAKLAMRELEAAVCAYLRDKAGFAAS